MRIRILSAKFHVDLEKQINDYIQDKEDMLITIQYADTSEGCSALIQTSPKIVRV